jgi:recombinational DNA repair protein (RecF pathway)
MGNEQENSGALYASLSPIGEADALVRFFTAQTGALTVKARGLRRSGSKLQHLLQPCDELTLSFAPARTRTPVLTGVSVHKSHLFWRSELKLLALYWFFIECAITGSGTPSQNEQIFQLIVNLLRSAPADAAARQGALAVFGIKLLALHGLLPSFETCALDGHAFMPGEVAHLLPNGEGLVGREAFNSRYARSGGALLRLDPGRLMRWRALLHGPLLDYPQLGADEWDAAVLLYHTHRQLADLAAHALPAAAFLSQSWKLPTPEALLARQLA